jgi:hypothetical protein
MPQRGLRLVTPLPVAALWFGGGGLEGAVTVKSRFSLGAGEEVLTISRDGVAWGEIHL